MLHRRPLSSSTSPHPPQSSLTPPAPPQTRNKAYTPLRRQSSNLYGTPPSQTAKPRYNLPSPSPVLSVNTGYSANQMYPFPSSSNTGRYSGFDDGHPSSGDWTEDAIGHIRRGLVNLKRGLSDASRMDRSWSLVWGDRELRTLVIKSTLVNLLSLLLLSLFPMFFSPIFIKSPNLKTRASDVKVWYDVLLSWPVFVLCFWINASWAPDISRRAQTLLHPTYRHQPPSSPMNPTPSSTPASPQAWIFTSLTRLLLISDFTLLNRLLALLPYVGRPLALMYMCIINAYYCFDSTFSSRSWPLDHRVRYMQERTGYMIGFGLITTLMSSFGPPLVNMAVFALIYPFFVIQALHSRPPTPRTSLLPSTPSPHASLPSSPSGSNINLTDPFFSDTTDKWTQNSSFSFQPRVPIFFFAQYAMQALAWMEVALGRDRGANRRGLGGGKERPGKRMM